ncbi:MAG: hypothetical protein ABSH20_07995 [Tepidisphaeraceae bacterium]|jgi:hypothetical protein
MEEQQEPVKKFKAGPVTCAVWQNPISVGGQLTTILKASVSRRYRDRDGTWKTSQSFSRGELPLAMFTMLQAFEFMLEQTSEQEISDAVGEVARE